MTSLVCPNGFSSLVTADSGHSRGLHYCPYCMTAHPLSSMKRYHTFDLHAYCHFCIYCGLVHKKDGGDIDENGLCSKGRV